MGEIQVHLTDEERQYLTGLLENALKDAQVEEHRTRTPSYRKLVIKDEENIKSVLKKIRPPAAAPQ